MRALIVHISIIAVTTLFGFAALIEETVTSSRGGLFVQYTMTKVIWLGIGFYALFSSLVVIVVYLFATYFKKNLTVTMVVLCHIVPVVIVAIAINYGVHDYFDDKRRQNFKVQFKEPSGPITTDGFGEQKVPVPVKTPLPTPLVRHNLTPPEIIEYEAATETPDP